MKERWLQIFLDFKNSTNSVERLTEQSELLHMVDQVFCPSVKRKKISSTLEGRWHWGQDVSPVEVANAALERSYATGTDLLFIFGTAIPSAEVVSVLSELLEEDPYFGFAIPRYADFSDGMIQRAAIETGDPEILSVPRSFLHLQDRKTILTELISPCLLVSKKIISILGLLDLNFQTIQGGLLHWLCRARRLGYRGVMAHRAVVIHPIAKGASHLTLPEKDIQRLLSFYPEYVRSKDDWERNQLHLLESLLGRVLSKKGELRKTLLIDARGLHTQHNGSSHAILGLLQGLAEERRDWKVTVMAEPAARSYHQLDGRFPFEVVGPETTRLFSFALRANQPWKLEDTLLLHQRAWFNLITFLDTISWDVVYPSPPGLEETWRFCAEMADALLFVSQFTQQRFQNRFPSSRKIPHLIHYHPFHPDEYAKKIPSISEDYFLLVGNHFDHKLIQETTRLVAEGFPFLTFKAFGLESTPYSRVIAIPSGQLPEEEVDELFARARFILFPSVYEGFGFPVLKGLSYGKTVITRQNSLLNELADHYRGPGRLLSFRNQQELVTIIAKYLHGEALPEIPLGKALHPEETPRRWADVARELCGFLDDLFDKVDVEHWRKRDQAVSWLRAINSSWEHRL